MLSPLPKCASEGTVQVVGRSEVSLNLTYHVPGAVASVMGNKKATEASLESRARKHAE